MGTRARQAIRKIEAEMTKQNQLPARRVPASKRPVRVKLRRINCDYHVPYAPESIKKDWWARLKKALGTASPDFVAEGAQPRIEIESIAAIQLACAHAATMQVLNALSWTTANRVGLCGSPAHQGHGCADRAAQKAERRAVAVRAG